MTKSLPWLFAFRFLLLLLLIEAISSLSVPMPIPLFDSLSGACSCGKIAYNVGGVTADTPAADCHCPNCRKYHVAAFASCVVSYEKFIQWEGEKPAVYRDSCGEKGPVDRLYCPSCYSKLATRIVYDDFNTILLNMGSIKDSSIPKDCNIAWKSKRRTWQEESIAPWAHAKPKLSESGSIPTMHEMTGQCACGEASYRVKYGPPSELQHCYCKLCRNLSGSAFMTWVPVPDFEWTSKEPPLMRATDHGQRHVCPKCSSVMTIVYDNDDGFVWPAAGGFDDASLPNDIEPYLQRVIHICCVWKQDWYDLPEDGLERVDYAC